MSVPLKPGASLPPRYADLTIRSERVGRGAARPSRTQVGAWAAQGDQPVGGGDGWLGVMQRPGREGEAVVRLCLRVLIRICDLDAFHLSRAV